MTREQLDRLRKTPAYPFIEAAHYLNMPVSTLRAWCIGQDYKVKGSTRRFQPLIVLDGAKSEGLSFLNLVEAHVLAAIRRTHDIPLPKVREGLAFMKRQMKSDRPLVELAFQTDGVSLFIEELSSLVNVTREGQIEMKELLLAHLPDRAGLGWPAHTSVSVHPVGHAGARGTGTDRSDHRLRPSVPAWPSGPDGRPRGPVQGRRADDDPGGRL